VTGLKKGATHKLENFDKKDLDALLEHIGDARYVLLGEASHGTYEFYTWRAEITKRLIAEKGFSFIAVEGDWPDCYRVNVMQRAWKIQVHPLTKFCMHLADGLRGCGQTGK
jgi:erythromycin esterase-like protein